MEYREGTIPKTVGQLRDRIAVAMLRVPRRQFADGYDFDGIFYTLERGIENLRQRFDSGHADQLLQMLAQAKGHYQAAEDRLGGALLNDIDMIIAKRKPWAYPKELYRWPINPWLPEVSEDDLLNKDDEESRRRKTVSELMSALGRSRAAG